MAQTLNYLYHQLQVNDPPNLNDPVWKVPHISLFLRTANKESVLRIVNSPGFPVPLTNLKRNRCWLASDVLKFFDMRSKGQLPVHPTPFINPQQEPKTLRLK